MDPLYVEFHNPTSAWRESKLVFDLRRVPAGIRLGLQFTPLRTVEPVYRSISGVVDPHAPDLLELVLRRVLKLLRDLSRMLRFVIGWWLGSRMPEDGPKQTGSDPWGPQEFLEPVYEAKPSTLVQVRGVRIAPHGFCAARIHIRAGAGLEPGREVRFEVQQYVGQKLVGGSTFVLVRPQRKPQIQGPPGEKEFAEKERLEREDPSRYRPPWLRYLNEHL